VVDGRSGLGREWKCCRGQESAKEGLGFHFAFSL
jgi:hypothetical protein